LVVATALVVILGAAVATLLVRGTKVWQKADGRLQQLFLMEKAFHRIGEDLRNGVSLADRPFQGSERDLLFATAEGPTRLAEVRYRIEGAGQPQALVRQRRPFPLGEEEGVQTGSPVQTRTLVPGVKSFAVEYGYLKETEGAQTSVSWAKTWDPTEQPLQVPKLLRVQIELETPQAETASFTREFLVPQGSLRNPPQ